MIGFNTIKAIINFNIFDTYSICYPLSPLYYLLIVLFFAETQIDVGVMNMEDDKFYAAMADTFIFVLFQVPIMIAVALLTAVVLNRKIIGRGFWRAVYFYPVMLSPVVVAFLWTLILKRQGVLSQTLIGWGWIDEPIQWLIDPSWTMFWSVFVYTWAHLGFYMIILFMTPFFIYY